MRANRVEAGQKPWPFAVLMSKIKQSNWRAVVREKILSIFLALAGIVAGGVGAFAAPMPAPPGLVGWWPGDGNANDMAGTNNGVLMGGATDTNPGFNGQCFTFDGTNAYVQIPNAPELNPTN